MNQELYQKKIKQTTQPEQAQETAQGQTTETNVQPEQGTTTTEQGVSADVEAKETDIERRKQEVRGDALERIGIDRVGFDGKQRQDWKDAKNQDLKIATNHAIERLSKNPNVKIASLPSAYANAIKAELEIHGVKTTDKTSISEIIEKLKEINAKYDAELKELENNTQTNETKQSTKPQQSNVVNTQSPEITTNQTDETAISEEEQVKINLERLNAYIEAKKQREQEQQAQVSPSAEIGNVQQNEALSNNQMS